MTAPPLLLQSAQDLSANFVFPNGQEARYVRRSDEYFIVYLSSHNGCNLACRFCHLTQTKQTAFVESSVEDMLVQAQAVMHHYAEMVRSGQQKPVTRVHLNWMARGEPLASSVVRGQWKELRDGLLAMLAAHGFSQDQVRLKLSTIFPKGASAFIQSALMTTLASAPLPEIYYSLYSLEESFRRRWLPNAETPATALAALTQWQDRTGGRVVLHWAFIKGQNDSAQSTQRITELIENSGIRAKFNLVRYNPFSPGQGEEAQEEVLLERFNDMLPYMQAAGSKIVPRVGFDVKASCGMFVNLST